jgi:hypothetical protein
MPRISHVDYQVVSAVGETAFTSSELALARKWAKLNAVTFPGLKVEKVTTTVERQQVYKPKPPMAAPDLSVPAVGAALVEARAA